MAMGSINFLNSVVVSKVSFFVADNSNKTRHLFHYLEDLFCSIADIFLEMHFFVYIVCFSLAHFHDDKKQRYIDCATFQLWKFCKHALIGFDLIMSEIYINQKLFT